MFEVVANARSQVRPNSLLTLHHRDCATSKCKIDIVWLSVIGSKIDIEHADTINPQIRQPRSKFHSRMPEERARFHSFQRGPRFMINVDVHFRMCIYWWLLWKLNVWSSVTSTSAVMEEMNIWHGIDELAFYENTTILQTLARSRENSESKFSVFATLLASNGPRKKSQWVCNFVDGFALTVAGSSGPSNVTAIGLERQELPVGCFTIRAANNEPFTRREMHYLQAN